MAQTMTKQPGRVIADNAAVSVIQVGNTPILEVLVDDIDMLGISLKVATQAIDAFVLEGRMSPDDAYQTIKSSTWQTPGGVLIASSGDLTTQAVGSGWAVIDVRAFYSVRFQASGGNATPSVVDARACGKGHRQ